MIITLALLCPDPAGALASIRSIGSGARVPSGVVAERSISPGRGDRHPAKLAADAQGKIQRLIINLPPRHLKSLIASIAFPAWCLGHDPSAQILCVSYAQDLADKLARDCRSIMMSPWYRRIFLTRLAPHRHAVQEF